MKGIRKSKNAWVTMAAMLLAVLLIIPVCAIANGHSSSDGEYEDGVYDYSDLFIGEDEMYGYDDWLIGEDGTYDYDGLFNGEDGIYDFDDLFTIENSTDSAQNIRPATEGYICDIVYVNGWTLSMGRILTSSEPEWGIYGLHDFSDESIVLVDDDPLGIIPCGDSFVYYTRGTDGAHHWFIQKPMEAPRSLPITWRENAFYGDENGIWYEAHTGTSAEVYYVDLDGNNKQSMGTVQGVIKGVLGDLSVVSAVFGNNTVLSWRDGQSTELYASPDESIRDVVALNDSVWVLYGDHFGRIVDGALYDYQEGYAMLQARSGHQAVLVVCDYFGSDEARIMLLNDITSSYTELGRVPYDDRLTRVELAVDTVIVWGYENRLFSIPASASDWTIYETEHPWP